MDIKILIIKIILPIEQSLKSNKNFKLMAILGNYFKLNHSTKNQNYIKIIMDILKWKNLL